MVLTKDISGAEALFKKLYEGTLLNNVSVKGLKFLSKDRSDITVEFIIKYVKGGRLLDVGCGNGDFIFRVKNLFDELYGVDILRRWQEKEEDKKINFIYHDLNLKMDMFSDEEFDVITSLSAIEHINDIFALVKEIKRVLRRNGTLIVSVPNIAYLKNRMRLLFGRMPVASSVPVRFWPDLGWDAGVLHYFTVRSLRGLFQSNDFHLIDVKGCGAFAKIRSLFPSLLCGEVCAVFTKMKG